MSNARRIYAELLKTASASKEAQSAKVRALGAEVQNPMGIARELGKQAAIDPSLLRQLALLGGGLGAAGGGLLAGRYLLPRSPSDEEALESIGITEPGEYSVGVSPDVFDTEEEEEEEAPEPGAAPYYGGYGRMY